MLQERAAFAHSALERCVEIAWEIWQRGAQQVQSKAHAQDLVTEADLRVEAFFVDQLQQHFPQDGLIAEEGARLESSSGWQWAIDPVDSTWSFARGYPRWAVALGAQQDGAPALSLVCDPCRAETWSAGQGGQLLLGGRPVEPRSNRALEDCALGVNAGAMAWLGARVEQVGHPFLAGSLALDGAWVAAGRLDAMIYHSGAQPWDLWPAQALWQATGVEHWLVPAGDSQYLVAARPSLAEQLRELLPG